MQQPYTRVEEREDGTYAPVLKVKGQGLVELGSYATARLAAVAYDVARLIFIHEKRPSTDLHMDQGTHHPADAYLCDGIFKALLSNGTSFADVCGLLRSGALADQFLCGRDRQTRHVTSNTSGERPAGSRHCLGTAGGAAATAGQPTEQLPAAQPQPKQVPQGAPAQQQQQQQQATPSSFASAIATATAQAVQGSPSPGKKKPMRWVEWPTKGGGQFLSCISERALKANMTLPAKMKRELFQTSEASAEIAVHDLQTGSTLRWTWEVRDYVKDERSSTYIHSLGPYFKHFNAQPGDVMVVVASAPGAVKSTVWHGNSQDATRFKAFLEKQSNSRQAGGAVAGSGSKKRLIEWPPLQQQPPPQGSQASQASSCS